MKGWREKRREARWKRKARMRNLEKINKNKKCLAAKIIWICSRFPWRRELKYRPPALSLSSLQRRFPWRRELKSLWRSGRARSLAVAFREGVSWNNKILEIISDPVRVAFREGVSWNRSISAFRTLLSVAFREGVSWNMPKKRVAEHIATSPSVKRTVEFTFEIFSERI